MATACIVQCVPVLRDCSAYKVILVQSTIEFYQNCTGLGECKNALKVHLGEYKEELKASTEDE